MTRLHATSKKCGAGFVPMIIIRNAKGQCCGSVVAANKVCYFRFAARVFALFVARKAAAKFNHVLVAE